MNFKYLISITVIICLMGCKSEKKPDNSESNVEANSSNTALEEMINTLTLDETYSKDDVRRYGVFPNQSIASHPKTGQSKMDELLNLAENGLELNFPKGIYKTVLNLSKRKDIKLYFDSAGFTGAVLLNGTPEETIKNIKLTGTLLSYSSFSSKYNDGVTIDSLIIKNDKTINISNLNSSGCNIYTGTLSLSINYLEIEGIGSDGEQYKYTPAALMVHGKSPSPEDILIKEAVIKSSDRHGAYLSGKFININKLSIQSVGLGKIESMPMIAYTNPGDEKEISAVWLNNFEDSSIDELYIDSSNSPKLLNTLFLDSGNVTFPSTVSTVNLVGEKVNVKKSPVTNVDILDIKKR